MLLFCLRCNADSFSSQNNKNGLYYFVVSESNFTGTVFDSCIGPNAFFQKIPDETLLKNKAVYILMPIFIIL